MKSCPICKAGAHAIREISALAPRCDIVHVPVRDLVNLAFPTRFGMRIECYTWASIYGKTYLVFLAPKAFDIAPGDFIHGVSIAHIGCCLVILLRSNGIFGCAPAISKAIRQFEDCKSQLALRNATFLHACLKSKLLDICTIGCRVGEVGNRSRLVLFNTPGMSMAISMITPECLPSWDSPQCQSVKNLTQSIILPVGICQFAEHHRAPRQVSSFM